MSTQGYKVCACTGEAAIVDDTVVVAVDGVADATVVGAVATVVVTVDGVVAALGWQNPQCLKHF